MQLEKKGVLRECQVELLGTNSFHRARRGPRTVQGTLRGTGRAGAALAHHPFHGRRAWPRRKPSVTWWCCAQRSRSAARAAALLPTRKSCAPSVKNASSSPGASGAGGKEHQGLQGDRVRGDARLATLPSPSAAWKNVDPGASTPAIPSSSPPARRSAAANTGILRDAALRIIRALKIEGGCNVQFALDPESFRYYVIEVNRACPAPRRWRARPAAIPSPAFRRRSPWA